MRMTITELDCRFGWLLAHMEYVKQLMKDALR